MSPVVELHSFQNLILDNALPLITQSHETADFAICSASRHPRLAFRLICSGCTGELTPLTGVIMDSIFTRVNIRGKGKSTGSLCYRFIALSSFFRCCRQGYFLMPGRGMPIRSAFLFLSE